MNAIRSVRAQPPAIFSSLQSSLGHKSSVISFRPVVTSSSRHPEPEPEPENPESMDHKEKNPKEKSGLVARILLKIALWVSSLSNTV